MDKLKMETQDLTQMNIEKIGEMFPNVVTETRGEDGKLKKAVNFELLKQMLSDEVLSGDEAYEFTWVGKKASIVEANKPIRKTLRPCKEESKNWDTTENLYIEGDNLEVLKLLQESYLGKVKMIYIDPPYNTGNDFIYRDDFATTREEWSEESGEWSEDGDRLFRNTDSNGRFHSDWCSMVFCRLILARNLLADEGVIFISIDENELDNLTKICDESFGEENHINTIVIKSNPRGSMSTAEIANLHEYLLLYSKRRNNASIIGHELTDEMKSEYKYSDEKGLYRLLGLRMRGGFWRRSERPNLFFPIYVNPSDGNVSLEKDESHPIEVVPVQPSTLEDGTWRWSKEKIQHESNFLFAKQIERNGDIIWDIYQKDYFDRNEGRRTKAKSIWEGNEINYQNGTEEIKTLFGSSAIFSYSKPVFLINQAMKMIDIKGNDIILDFFSGSSTTAHSVMQLNAEDGGNRKFIMVQLQEPCDEKSEAYKAGYKNICEIGKERIRRAGDKIVADLLKDAEGEKTIDNIKKHFQLTLEEDHGKKALSQREIAENLDIGFRVLKLDDTNMKDVYYSADEYDQKMLVGLENNIKEDRTDLDLLFGCLLDWGLSLSMPYTSETIESCSVHTYNNGDLIACFDNNVPESVIREIAKRLPLRAVFRDSSFTSSPEKINVEEIFKLLSPNTTIKVI